MVRAHDSAQDRYPAELLVRLERAVALDAAIDLGTHSQGVGKPELVPARHSARRHAVVEQLVGALQQRVDRVGESAFLDGTLGELGQVPSRGRRLEPVTQFEPGMADAGRGDDVESSGAGEHQLQLGERLDRTPQPAARPAHALGYRLELAVVWREQGQHPVGLAQLEAGQDDRFCVVDARHRHACLA